MSSRKKHDKKGRITDTKDVDLKGLTFAEYCERQRENLGVMTIPLPGGCQCRSCGAMLREAKFSPRSGQWLAVCGKCRREISDAGSGLVAIYVDDPKLNARIICTAGFTVPPCPFTLPKRSKCTSTIQPKNRCAAVEAYIKEVLVKTGRKITRREIWGAAGYTDRTEFQRWQRNDQKRQSNKRADRNFTHVLTEKPHLK